MLIFQELKSKTKLPVYITTNEEPAGFNFTCLTLAGEGNTTDRTGATAVERCGWYSVYQLKVIVFFLQEDLKWRANCLLTNIYSMWWG